MSLLDKNPDAVARLGNAIWSYHECYPDSKALLVLTYIHEFGIERLLFPFFRKTDQHHDNRSYQQPTERSRRVLASRNKYIRYYPLSLNINIHFHISDSGKIDFDIADILMAIDKIGKVIENRIIGIEEDPSLGKIYRTMNDAPSIVREKIREDIIEWVSRLHCYVAQSMQTKYVSLWQSIISLHELEDEIYRPGKQKNVTFNRNLVANIICILKRKGVIYETNDTLLSKALRCNDSARKNLNIEPNKAIKDAVIKLLANDAFSNDVSTSDFPAP